MTVNEFLQHLRSEDLDGGVHNVVGRPLTADEIGHWEADHPDFTLPDDYKSLLQAADGFTVRASGDSPNGMLRVLPLSEVKPLAEQVMEICGIGEEDLTDPPTCLMVGEDQDTQWCLGLDTAIGHFLEVGYTGETTDLDPLPETLDWIVERSSQWGA
jgi:hypothetical protein